jgi:predicted aldo/keto reductase-like oxidoreductase
MLYREIGQTGCQVSQLGFGCMRLRTEDGTVEMMNPNKAVDQQLATRLIRHAMDCGVNYFDTAYPYLGGQSETVLGKALQEGRRQKVFLTTKLPLWLAKSGADFEAFLNQQLQKLGTDYLDFYLLHGLNAASWEKALSFNVLEFLERIKADGRARQVGFSFHDQFPVFRSIVDAYNWSLCQIQFNYVDVNYQAGLTGLQYAAEKRLGLMIMEPLRGGKLAEKLPPDVEAIWSGAKVRRSPAEWALRWLWNFPAISCVLSGMNTMQQLEENINVASDATPNTLTEEELVLFDRVKAFYEQRIKVDCTGCGYCMPCPEGVNIPGNFSAYNQLHMFDEPLAGRMIPPEQRADACKECGECEDLCPQKLPIRELLKDVARELPAGGLPPMPPLQEKH